MPAGRLPADRLREDREWHSAAHPQPGRARVKSDHCGPGRSEYHEGQTAVAGTPASIAADRRNRGRWHRRHFARDLRHTPPAVVPAGRPLGHPAGPEPASPGPDLDLGLGLAEPASPGLDLDLGLAEPASPGLDLGPAPAGSVLVDSDLAGSVPAGSVPAGSVPVGSDLAGSVLVGSDPAG